MKISEYNFRSIGEIDCYMWTRYNETRKSHRLSLRKKNEKYEVYRKFNDKSEEIVYQGKLECAVAVLNTQNKLFCIDAEKSMNAPFQFEYTESS